MKKLLLYLIIFLLDLSGIIQSQTNHPPISPKWIFEPWVWEDQTNTEQAALDLKNNYLIRDIPVGALIIDSPWEEQENGLYNEDTNNGYNTFKFNGEWYNKPYTTFNFINDSLYKQGQGIHVILWMTGIIDSGCALFQTAKEDSFFVNKGRCTDWWKGSTRAAHIDFFNTRAVNFWKNLMDRIYINKYEVDGWKVDQSDFRLGSYILTSEGIKTHQQYSEAYYDTIFSYIRAKRQEQGMITARPYCYQTDMDSLWRWNAPIRVNTAGWVGDQTNSWGGLKLALNNIFISAAAGYAAVGSDIGGYLNENDAPDRNLFLRWAQLGALMPIMENGGNRDNCHQPWLFDTGATSIYRYYAKLHHELVPYLYSYDIQAHLTDTSIIRPIGARSLFPKDTNSWNNAPLSEYDYNYLLGDNLFVSVIAQNKDSLRKVTFPPGKWIDYWNDDNIYQGETTATINYTVNKYPLFIKDGGIIPLNVDDKAAETGHGTDSSKNYLTLLVYPDGISSFKYYRSEYDLIEIKCNNYSGGYTISFSQNTGSVIIRLKNKNEPDNIRLSGNIILQRKNSFSEFESSPSGWFYGKINSHENVYAWIKFSDPADTVYFNAASVTDLHPENYEFSDLIAGNKYYVDRNYTLLNIPYEYQGFKMIKTANNDKKNSDPDFYFNVNGTADIYIAYDHRLAEADRVPDWLSSDYLKIDGKVILGTDYTPGDITVFDIWKKKTSASGQVIFGFNNGIDESSMYFVFYETFSAYIKVYLQGPYAGNGIMNTTLQTNGNIPTSQPYGDSPWSYSGTERVDSTPSGVVDWVLVQLRTATTPGDASTATDIVKQRAVFLMSDGSIHDIDGSTHINFSKVSAGDYYIVVCHRNHLAVMSAGTVSLPNSSTYDFTTDSTQAYGTGKKPMAYLGSGKYGMWAGDVNGDGTIKYNLSGNDRALIYTLIGGGNVNATVSGGYYNEDVNLDGIVKYNLSNNDRAIIYQNIGGGNVNATISTKVPSD